MVGETRCSCTYIIYGSNWLLLMLAYPALASSYHSKINLMTSRIQFNTQNSLVAQANHMLVNLMAPYNLYVGILHHTCAFSTHKSNFPSWK